MYSSLLLVLSLTVGLKGLHVHGPSGPLVTQIGGTVLLPCFLENPVSLDGLQIEWTTADSLVNVFQQGQIGTEAQSQSFRGRVDFFPDEVSKGNFSVTLKNVSKEDAGVYKCKVSTVNESNETVLEIKLSGHFLLKGADQTIFASAGDEVVLNCSVDSHLPVHEIEEVIWIKNDGEILAKYNMNSDDFYESYQGRAEFFITEIPNGNFSLKLKDVRLEDKGELICEIRTSHMSASTIVVLQCVGFSKRHMSILLLCSVALLITVGLCFPTFRQLKNKVASRMDLTIPAVLILCPNICMFVAYVLWSKEGFLYEAVVCSIVSITRPIMLMKTSPNLSILPDRLKKEMKARAVPYHLFFITMAALSILATRVFDDTAEGMNDVRKVIIAVGTTVYFISAVIAVMCLPIQRVCLTMLLEALNGLILARTALFACTTEADFDLSLQIISGMPHLLMALMIVLLLQNHCSQRKPFKRFHLAVSFMVIPYSLMDICIYAYITINMRGFSSSWILLFEAVIFIIAWLAVMLLLCCRKEELSLQRGKEYFSCTVTAVVGTIVYGAACLHYTAKLLENRKDSAGYLALGVLIHVLATTALFKHPKHLPDLPHIVIYMFGAVGLTVINSITLATELILKAGRGARTIEDLRVIVLPFETLFVCAWLALQIYDAWMRAKDRTKLNFEDETEAQTEVHTDTDPLMTHINHPS